MFQQVANPVGGSLALSALVAALPLLTLFVLLGALSWKAWQAGLASLVVALGVAIFAFGMPAGQALLAATEGAAFGLFPIIWIVLTAIWIFRMTELTGLRPGAAPGLRLAVPGPADPGDHHRVLLRRAAGGARRLRHPGRGHRRDADRGRHLARSRPPPSPWSPTPLRSRSAPSRSRSPPSARSPAWTPTCSAPWSAGRPRSWRLRAADPGAHGRRHGAACGRPGSRRSSRASASAIAQFLCSNYFSYQVADIIAALAGALAVVLLLRVWQPSEIVTAESARRSCDAGRSRAGSPGRSAAHRRVVRDTGCVTVPARHRSGHQAARR